MASIARIATGLAFIAVAYLLSSAANPMRVAAVQFLQNGGYEQGLSGWAQRIGFSIDCQPRIGVNAGALTTTVDGPATVRQTVNGPLSSGPYELRGYVRTDSGAPSFQAVFHWFDASGPSNVITRSPMELMQPSASWTLFSHEVSAPAGAFGVAVELRSTATGASVVCLDDLTLDGPELATPTPTATSTATSTVLPTATATLEASPTMPPTAPNATSTVPPTATATLETSPTLPPPTIPNATSTIPPSATPVPTATSPPPTATAAPATPTATPQAGPTFAFTNGGFEEGTAGWQKFGGELRAVNSPRAGGAGAGALESNTASTKWAFQPVRVDAATMYEFKGHLQPGTGVAQAYLRISWYASADASGQAIATDDSPVKLSGASSGFVFLTTGPRTPPAGARSARLRVMLAPATASSATLYMDDFAFGVASPMATPPPASTVAAPDEPFETSATTSVASPAQPQANTSPASQATAGTAAVGAPSPSGSPAGASQIAFFGPSQPALQRTPASADLAAEPIANAGDADGSLVQTAVVAGLLFFGALGGAYVIGKRLVGTG